MHLYLLIPICWMLFELWQRRRIRMSWEKIMFIMIKLIIKFIKWDSAIFQLDIVIGWNEKVGPKAKCPQKLTRVEKMLRQGHKWPLKLISGGGGRHLYFTLDIILIKGLSKHTLNTYFSGTKIDPKFAFLHAFFLICLSCPFQNWSIWPKTHLFFKFYTFLHS